MGRFIRIIIAFFLVLFFMNQFSLLRGEYAKARHKALNEIPLNSFDDLVVASEQNKVLETDRLDAYLKYAEAILRSNPQRADAWGLSGYALAQKEDYQRAIFSYVRASSIEPKFFGFYYNLAYIYFKTGQYDLAIDHVEKALLCDPRESMIYVLSSSKIYALMLVARINRGVTAEEQLKRGYLKAYQLMAAIQYRLKMRMAFPGEENLSLEVY